MAKLKFGSIDIKAEMPEQNVPIVAQRHPVIDPSAIIEEVMSMIPKAKEIVHQDLSYLENAISSQGHKLLEHQLKLDSLAQMKHETIVMPEMITHIKDVSKEVMEQVEANKVGTNAVLRGHTTYIVAIEAKLKTQKVINIIMISMILVTIISRLF